MKEFGNWSTDVQLSRRYTATVACKRLQKAYS